MRQLGQLRQLWQNDGCALNGWLSLPCGFSAELMAKQGWDCLTIDMQHGLIDYAAATAMLAAAGEVPVLVRVPWLGEADIMKALDAGAAGIISPMINNRAEAERFAACVRYPPMGRRSFGPIRALAHYGADYYQRANDEVIALAMIETKEGLAAVDEVLSTPGIDGVYIGPADLSCSLGYPPSFQPTAPAVLEAISLILAAAQKHQAIAGIHTNEAATARDARSRGFKFVTAATDARLMNAAGAAVLSQLREEKKDENTTHDDGAGAGGLSGGATY